MHNGFCIIRANQLESLATLALEHCRNEPLAPLEEEIFLVQSNGMADWLKLQQAQGAGISAGMRFPMPASFLWQMYQQVLSPALLHQRSPFEKDSMQWRLLRLLPTMLDEDGFERPRQFLHHDSGETKRFQLACKQADLFDQYQLYRSDWLATWEAGELVGLGPDEYWQAALWRALVASMAESERQRSRAHLHQAFIERLQQGVTPEGLPKRIFLFGISSLPRQVLEALYALSNHCQLLLMILSPCEHYWADRGIGDLEAFEASNQLLDSWGAQGRDFLRLMTEYEPTEIELAHTRQIDPYADAAAYTRGETIICQLQQAMLDNQQPPAGQMLPANPGLAFYPAYSRQREVEVLHDQLLSLFTADAELQYSDVVVMMPDVDRYAPHIEAVFNRYAHDDPRRLAFAISDRHDHDTPLYKALEYVLDLPSQRLTLSEVLSLLQLPAIQQQAGINEDDLTTISAWIDASHVRWGWDAAHKQQILELAAEPVAQWRSHNTWRAGLDQLLAGYCAGDADIFSCVAVDEVSANQGVLLGRLAQVVGLLGDFRNRLAQSCTPADWGQLFEQLLAALFVPASDEDRLMLDELRQALAAWQDDCALAGFTDELPLAQARQGWLDRLAQRGMGQQLAFNGVTFCTLMPMRALPFRHIFLLGMNDGDYPREQQPVDFDLMEDHYRAGDRNRRDDDQYLFLEALMSVRDSLSISWVGFDINKNIEKPACTLVAQLREQVDRHWQTGEVDAHGNALKPSDVLTQTAPLAAFSRRYFEVSDAGATPAHWPGRQPPHTWASEWQRLHQAPVAEAAPAEAAAACPEPTLLAGALTRLLKTPQDVFYRDRLQTAQIEPEQALEDAEPFALNGLERWRLRNDVLASLLHEEAPPTRDWLDSGALPPGGLARAILKTETDAAASIQQRWQQRLDEAVAAPPQQLSLELTALGTTGMLPVNLTDLWQRDSQLILAQTAAGNVTHHGKWRFDKLAACWINHLAACASGLQANSFIVARDRQLGLPPMPAVDAQWQLNRLFLVYLQAWQRPLPVNSQDIKLPEAPEIIPVREAAALLEQIHGYWPESAADEQASEFWAELLYRPIQTAIAEGQQ